MHCTKAEARVLARVRAVPGMSVSSIEVASGCCSAGFERDAWQLKVTFWIIMEPSSTTLILFWGPDEAKKINARGHSFPFVAQLACYNLRTSAKTWTPCSPRLAVPELDCHTAFCKPCHMGTGCCDNKWAFLNDFHLHPPDPSHWNFAQGSQFVVYFV